MSFKSFFFFFFGLVRKLLIIIKFWGKNKWFLMWLFDFSQFYENCGYMFLGLLVLYFILRIMVINLGNHGSYNHPKIKIKELLVLVIPKFFTWTSSFQQWTNNFMVRDKMLSKNLKIMVLNQNFVFNFLKIWLGVIKILQ